jgi:hypothetical protein
MTVGPQIWTRCDGEKNKMSFISSTILPKLFTLLLKDIRGKLNSCCMKNGRKMRISFQVVRNILHNRQTLILMALRPCWRELRVVICFSLLRSC